MASPESTQYQYMTPFDSTASEETPRLRNDRPALLVSSTSWTADENFDMLLEALREYEMKARRVNGSLDSHGESEDGNENVRLPKVFMIVTGKGPLKDKYMDEVIRLETSEEWEWVRCRSLWLEAGAYPILLGLSVVRRCSASML